LHLGVVAPAVSIITNIEISKICTKVVFDIEELDVFFVVAFDIDKLAVLLKKKNQWALSS
jgi:hypothetical protein